MCLCEDGTKYVIENGVGLRVTNIELRDNGTYVCRAAVDSHDTSQLRYVHLNVLCSFISCLSSASVSRLTFANAREI